MSTTSLDKQYVAEVFHNLEVKGQAPKFLEKVADDVDWTVKGTHPLAGHYTSKKRFQVNINGSVPTHVKLRERSKHAIMEWIGRDRCLLMPCSAGSGTIHARRFECYRMLAECRKTP